MKVSCYWVTYVLLIALSIAVFRDWQSTAAVLAFAYPVVRALTGYASASRGVLFLEVPGLVLVELLTGSPVAVAYGVGLLAVVLVDGVAAVYLTRNSLLDGVMQRWVRANAVILPLVSFTLIPLFWRLYA